MSGTLECDVTRLTFKEIKLIDNLTCLSVQNVDIENQNPFIDILSLYNKIGVLSSWY
jgi:hypothetical protein